MRWEEEVENGGGKTEVEGRWAVGGTSSMVVLSRKTAQDATPDIHT